MLLAIYQIAQKSRPIGTFLALSLYWRQITRPIYQLAHAYKELITFAVEAEPLLQIMQTWPTVTDAKGANDLNFKGGKVEFKNVWFTYDRHKDFIKDLSFTIEAGSTVAFVGETGAGKTTICNKLLFRFYDVTGGQILIDGQDIRKLKQHNLREMIGIVPQDPAFFSTTVLEAVRYARLDATDEEVYEACKAASIHDTIIGKPCGYGYQVGERGCRLSGGERQRLAVARVFLRDPKIIVLDEATSIVDNVTEARIQQALSQTCRGKTTFIIAHRLSTVVHADQIFLIDQGTIAERGTHQELLRQKGKYWQLWHKKISKADPKHKYESGIHDYSDDSTAADLIDLTDETASLLDSSTNFCQLDGQGDSKHRHGSNLSRIKFRPRLRNMKGKLCRKRRVDPAEGREHNDDSASDVSPMQEISPRPTNTTIASPPRRRSLSRRGKRSARGSNIAASGGEVVPTLVAEIEAESSSPKKDRPSLNILQKASADDTSLRRSSATLTDATFDNGVADSRYYTPAPSIRSSEDVGE
jgi:ABC-type multidrug transport system ATPase subunit